MSKLWHVNLALQRNSQLKRAMPLNLAADDQAKITVVVVFEVIEFITAPSASAYRIKIGRAGRGGDGFILYHDSMMIYACQPGMRYFAALKSRFVLNCNEFEMKSRPRSSPANEKGAGNHKMPTLL